MEDTYYDIYFEDTCIAQKVAIGFVVPFIRTILSDQNWLPEALTIRLHECAVKASDE